MQLTKVESSMIFAVGYDDCCQQMEVVFFNGVYRYYDVPKTIYEGLMQAPSKGRYMHDYVLHRYPYRPLQGIPRRERRLALDPSVE